MPPRRATAIALIALAAATVAVAGAEAQSPPALRQGINVGDYLAYPQSRDWPVFRGPRAATSDKELATLAAAGFDFVRLAVEPSPFLDRSPGEVQALERRLVDIVDRIVASGMRVMISGWSRHETTPHWRAEEILERRDGPALRAYLAFLKRIVVLLRNVPQDKWVLQPMNEPQAACRRGDGPDWIELQRDIHRELRAAAPQLTLVLTTGCWSKLEGLTHLDMTGYDDNTLVDLHYYEPYAFTHQSATWGAEWIKSLAGLSFPPSRTDRQAATEASARLFTLRNQPGGAAAFAETIRKIDVYVKENAGPERIDADFARIRAWAERQRVDASRVVIGEFGAYRTPKEAKAPDDGSRERWIETVRTAAARNGFGWAFYAYHSDFGLVIDEASARWDERTRAALGLKQH